MSAPTTLAVDVGGTFTDAVVNSPQGVFTAKTPTTPSDQSIGVIEAARGALAAGAMAPEQVDQFLHGMTVTTNALLEGELARTALLTTEGFTDIEQLGRQNRADLYRLGAARPAPIVPPELRFPIAERCGPEGVIRPLDVTSVREALDAAKALGAEAIAVCLLFSFAHPAHELQIAEVAREVSPELHVSLSHQTVGTFREYERFATTIADAALGPLLAGYLDRLTERAQALGLPEPQVMLSSGGTVPARTAGANASWTVLSGPAGGAVGAARSATRRGATNALAVDMGGTSTDIALIDDGDVAIVAGREIDGRPIALPSIDVSTVGAGGGSIAWRDEGGALRVGPRSAGARPGPACYGHGGREATVTDANLMLGYLADDSQLAGGLQLDRGAAESAISGLADELGLSPIATASGIVEIANLEMIRATSAATVARGIDPRGHTLIAFGGAGPMHAAAIAAALQIRRVICPAACGVLSAWGISVAGARFDRSRSIVRPLDELSPAEIEAIELELAGEAISGLGTAAARPTTHTTFDLRYLGQAFELPVTAPTANLATAFHIAHEQRFGFAERTASVELVTVRVSASLPPVAASSVPSATTPVESKTRRAWFDEGEHEARVFTHGLPPDERHAGPLLIQQLEATIVVPPGWSASMLGGDVILEQIGSKS